MTQIERTILVQPQKNEYPLYQSFADREGLRFEYTDFGMPAVLNDDAQFQQALATYQGDKRGFSLHGAFIDINTSSVDKEIRQICRRRLRQSCQAAQALGLSHIVFHSNYIPVLNQYYYVRNWLNENALFYQELLEEFPITIYLENMEDFHPDMLLMLVEKVKHPRCKICLDIGHANFSKAPLRRWFASLAPYIGYLHLSDNYGTYDEHLPLGQGAVDWHDFNKWIERYQLNPITLLEVSGSKNIEQSISYLKEQKIFPYN